MDEDNRPFYAVHRGRTPGIYRTWEEADEQVHGFPRARYKKYFRRENAEAFMRGENPDAVPPRLPAPPDLTHIEAFHEARCAPIRPVVGYRGQTIRLPATATAAPYVRLLRALGCRLSAKASRWLDSFE